MGKRTYDGQRKVSPGQEIWELQESVKVLRTENVRKAHCWQKEAKIETQTGKHTQVLTTLIHLGRVQPIWREAVARKIKQVGRFRKASRFSKAVGNFWSMDEQKRRTTDENCVSGKMNPVQDSESSQAKKESSSYTLGKNQSRLRERKEGLNQSWTSTHWKEETHDMVLHRTNWHHLATRQIWSLKSTEVVATVQDFKQGD